jgi:hypothetical protein
VLATFVYLICLQYGQDSSRPSEAGEQTIPSLDFYLGTGSKSVACHTFCIRISNPWGNFLFSFRSNRLLAALAQLLLVPKLHVCLDYYEVLLLIATGINFNNFESYPSNQT